MSVDHALGGEVYVQDSPLDQIIDETDANCVYVGWAVIGTLTSEGKWRIKRVKISGTTTSIGWASSTDTGSQIWDNRASLTYSQGG